jgi:hypothetical protein
MKFFGLLKAKALIAIVAGVLLVGGATAAFASTSAGQNVVRSLVHGPSTVTARSTQEANHNGQNTGKSNQDRNTCPGLSDAQNLATKYHLSTASQGDAVKAICALHQGTFKGTSSSGVTVAATRVYGYGEIDQLLTYAQYLASHDKANAGGKLTDTNVSSYLAAALHSCGTSPLETCLKTNIPNYHPGNTDHGNGNGGNGSGNKPTTTPTPHKPPVTPTPHH